MSRNAKKRKRNRDILSRLFMKTTLLVAPSHPLCSSSLPLLIASPHNLSPLYTLPLPTAFPRWLSLLLPNLIAIPTFPTHCYTLIVSPHSPSLFLHFIALPHYPPTVLPLLVYPHCPFSFPHEKRDVLSIFYFTNLAPRSWISNCNSSCFSLNCASNLCMLVILSAIGSPRPSPLARVISAASSWICVEIFSILSRNSCIDA